MRPLPLGLARTLTPVGWASVIGAGLIALVVVAGGLGFRWDPFDLGRKRLRAAEAQAVHAAAEASARRAEAVGQAGQIARLDTAIRTTQALDRAIARSTQDARTADDASTPLSADRARRLRDHDVELCRIAPGLVGCAAPPDPAGGGQPLV